MYQKNILFFKTPAKGKFGGFTLIELLVVVLIIGVLAAIAFPQYQKVIKRSRAAELRVLIKNIEEAQKNYLMANGTYTQCLNDLDVHVLSSFTNFTETDGCITAATKGTGDQKVTLSASRYLDNGWLDKGATNYTFVAYLGDYIRSGNGGYGIRLGFNDFEREPLSCIEYACYAVEEGSFCHSVMGLKTEGISRDCTRFYNE